MDEVLPLEIIENNFKAKIFKLTMMTKRDGVIFYEAVTSFGHMTLIVQSFFQDQDKQQLLTKDSTIFQKLSKRNMLLAEGRIISPLIYQQQVMKIRQHYFVCMTLCEPIVICQKQEIVKLQVELIYSNLINCAYKVSQTQFAYHPDCFNLEIIVKSIHNFAIFLDFTRINLLSQSQPQEKQNFSNFKKQLIEIMKESVQKQIQQIFFIRQTPYTFNLSKIHSTQSWFDLAMMFNLLHHDKVLILSESKSKASAVNRLEGYPKFQYSGVAYSGYEFRDGFRVDGLTPLTLEDLKAKFFQDNVIYYMTKDKYMCVRKNCIQKQENWIISNIDYDQMIYVRPQISKVQFINFLIGYIKYIEPILHQINFYEEENILQIVFTSRLKKIRRFVIKFHQRYVVKDEELCMIIEKSQLRKAIIQLKSMCFGDSFLIFLANCDKMVNVRSLDISYCSKITQSGINSLLASPFCQNLQILKVCSLPLFDLSVVKFKQKLKQLYINECSQDEADEQITLSNLVIERLQAFGLQIGLKLPQTIQYLYLSSQITLQNLKLLKNLPLIELKINLTENKKIISSFFGAINNIYTKQNPVKIFAQGHSHKTLKLLDISNSTIRLKEIKPILHIESLQTLICNNIQKDKFMDLTLPNHIISISVMGSRITAEIFTQMTSKTQILIKLNIINTDIKENSLESCIKNKKYINCLQLDQEQINFRYFQKKTCIQGVAIHIHKLIRDENQPILNDFLLRLTYHCKQINLVCKAKCQDHLVKKLGRFFILYEDRLKQVANQLTLNINGISIFKLINFRHKQNINEYFTVVNNKTSNHKTKILSNIFLSQDSGLPLISEYMDLNLFNVTLHKIILKYPDSLLQISIRSNRLLSKEVIPLINTYFGPKIKALDFRNCLFTYQQVHQYLYLFPNLQSVNEGQYQISLNEDDNCEKQLQKLLKFFMKLNSTDKMKLKLIARNITQSELYFSIIFEIIHHFCQSIVSLKINFENIAIEYHHSQHFWEKIFQLKKLEHFHVYYQNQNDFLSQQFKQKGDDYGLVQLFQKLNTLNLFSFELDTSIRRLIPQQLLFPQLKRLSLNLSELQINENVLLKILRNIHSLHSLNLNMQNCSNLTSVNRLSEALQKMKNLVNCVLNFESCPLKQNSIIELIQHLSKNVLLQKFELNVNNCNIATTELVKACQKLVENVKFCHISIFALQQKKHPFFRDTQQLISKGIDILFTF